ncbi:MAG: hypothetical protein ACTSP4_04790 [Candidatus Hodarchaeales archaeon]
MINYSEIKNLLISKLIELRNSLKTITYQPVVLYLKYLKLMDELTVISHDFYTDVRTDHEIVRENLMAVERFVFHYLDEFSKSIRRMQSKLVNLDIKDTNTFSEILFHMKYLGEQINVFGNKIEDRLTAFLGEYTRIRQEHERCFEDSLFLESKLKKIKQFFHFGELALQVFKDVKIKNGRMKTRTSFVFTTERLLIVKRNRLKPWKRVEIIHELTPEDLVDTEITKLRFWRKKMTIKSLNGDIAIFTRKDQLINSLKDQIWKHVSGSYSKISPRSSIARGYRTAWDIGMYKKRIDSLLSLKLDDSYTATSGGRNNVFLNSLFKKVEAANEHFNSLRRNKSEEVQTVKAALQELKKNYHLHLVSPKDYYELFSLYKRKLQKLERELTQLKGKTNLSWI